MENEKYLNIFTTQTKCDLCQQEDSRILEIIIKPVFQFNGKKMTIKGSCQITKCQKCIEGDFEDFEDDK